MFYVSGVHFLVGLTEHYSVDGNEIIKFDKIINNIGRGYMDDANSTDYGKFVAPGNGTYQFNAIIYSQTIWIAADLMKNEEHIIIANNGGGGPGSLSVVLDLKEGEKVYLKKTHWVLNGAVYDKYITSFSGVLVHPFPPHNDILEKY